MSNLSVGDLTTTGTKTIVTGTSSGLNTGALIENAVAQNNVAADKIDIKIQENDLLIAGYEEWYGLAQNFQDSLFNIKSQTSILDTGNVFSQRTANLESTGSPATSLINVSIDEDAPEGSYDLVIEQKAEAFSTGSTNVVDKDADLNEVGSFTIGIDGYAAQQIDVVATDSLQDIADKINLTTADSGVSASIVKVSETEYQLILEGTDTNAAMTVSTLSGSVMQNLGIVDVADTFEAGQIIQNEQGSRVIYNGATITRDDNAYDDLIDGLSFDIVQADAGSTLTLDVSFDSSSAKDAILDFVDSYNAFREFAILNQQVNADGSIPEEAILFSDTLLDSFNYQISTLLAGASGDGLANSLRGLGIEFDGDNRLVVKDGTKLDDALLSDFENVANFFATDVSIDNDEFRLISNTSSTESLDFTIDITTDVDGNITAATVGGSSVFTINGNSLVGQAGTVYEGLTFAYAGTTDTSINVTMNAGVADLLYNTIENYTAADGSIQDEITALNAENEDYTEEAQEIRDKGEEIREEQIQVYAAMEAELARLDSLLNTVRALLGNNNDD
ncbi:MAG: flagellar filament capping protein FliD [Alphaproteobacteria bacterium]|nr:flagellar filament capping protein FliD [Alphaproteobacteria bacterium]